MPHNGVNAARHPSPILKVTAQMRRQESTSGSVRYLFEYLARRGPAALRRWWYSRTETAAPPRPEKRRDIAHLAVLVNGGVGDHIVAARFMRDLRKACEPFAFDIFSASPGVASWIFSNAPGFQNCSYDTVFHTLFNRFDLSLNLSGIVKVHSFGQHGDGKGLGPKLRECIGHVDAFAEEMKPLFESSQRMDGFLAQKLQFKNVTRANSLHSMAGIQYSGDALPLHVDRASLGKFSLAGQRYITVHNGFEAKYVTAGTPVTKCYPHFGEVVALLKEKFKDIRVVQIGAKTSVPIREADLNLLGRTTLPEAGAIIQGAAAHLDNESGMVHMASCFGVPACVVFGPTPADYFAYPNNVSVRPKSCGGCWWITEDWMERCPRGFAEPICTYSQPPSEVAQAMGTLLSGKFDTKFQLVKSSSVGQR